MESSDFTPRRNREHINQGIWELQSVLAPFVRERMTATYGPDWRQRAAEILKRPVGTSLEKDVSSLLFLISKDFETFEPTLRSENRSTVSYLLTARNQSSHEAEVDVSTAFHIHDCLCKLFARLEHEAPAIAARRTALQVLLAQEVQPSTPTSVASAPKLGADEKRSGGASGRSLDKVLEHFASGGDAEPTPRLAPITPPLIGSRGHVEAEHTSITPKVALIVAACVIGAVVIVGVVQLKRADNRPDGLNREATAAQPSQSGSPVQAPATSPADSGRQGSMPARSRIPSDAPMTGTQPFNAATPSQPPPVRDERIAASDSRDQSQSPSTNTAGAPRDQAGGSQMPAAPASADAARPIEAPIKREPLNLVTNGEFREAWDVGWNKEVKDPTQGSFVVERQNAMLHLTLAGQNTAQVWQVVALPEDRGLDGLMFEAGVKLIPKRMGMLGLAPPVETALILQIRDRQEQSLGEIWYTGFATTGLEGSGLVGVPDTLHATGQRCQILLAEGFNRIAEALGRKAKDCLSTSQAGAASVMVVCLMRTSNRESSAEAFLDRVRLYYR